MAKTDWVALITEPTSEYAAHTELSRFCLSPYLPQIRRRFLPPQGGAALVRKAPLFPRYLFILAQECRNPAIRCVRGLRKVRPLLTDETGRPWLAPAHVIDAIKENEERGTFDEIVSKGDPMKFANGVLANVTAVMERSSGNVVHLLTPLFNGCRATAPSSKVMRA